MARCHTRCRGVVLAALLLLALGGCQQSDECASGETKCDGNAAWTCQPIEDGNGGHNVWQTLSCGSGVCRRDDLGSAFCALSNVPEPKCVDDKTTFCTGTLLTQCHSGFASGTFDCATGMPSATAHYPPQSPVTTPFCVPASAGGRCAAEPEPNPACAGNAFGEPYQSVCIGNDMVDCVEGYVVRRTPCTSGTFCEAGGFALCALSSDPDPSCPMTERTLSYCEGDAVVVCEYGYRAAKQACAAGETCHITPGSCIDPNDGQCTSASCQ